MPDQAVREEIQKLRAELERYNEEYYVNDQPSVSDFVYDERMNRLLRLEAEYPELITPDSPTQRVGGAVSDGFDEVVHTVPMQSLADVFSKEELCDFDSRTAAAPMPRLPPVMITFILGPPFDTANVIQHG